MDQLRVVPRDGDAGEGCGEHIGSSRINLIENEPGASALRQDGEQAGARRGFEHKVRSRDPASEQSEVGDRGKSGELLKLDLLFAADAMGRQARDQVDQSCEAVFRRGGKVHVRQVHDLGDFEHVIGIAQ